MRVFFDGEYLMFAFQFAELNEMGEAKNLKNSDEIVRERDLAENYGYMGRVACCIIIKSERYSENGDRLLISG